MTNKNIKTNMKNINTSRSNKNHKNNRNNYNSLKTNSNEVFTGKKIKRRNLSQDHIDFNEIYQI
jgi:hypothetical protein